MSNKKTLLFLSPYCYPCVTGGIEVFNYNLIEKLSEIYTIHLVTLCKSLHFEKVIIHNRNDIIPLKISWPFFVIFNVLKYRKSIGLIYFSHARGHWFYWLMMATCALILVLVIYVSSQLLFGVVTFRFDSTVSGIEP